MALLVAGVVSLFDLTHGSDVTINSPNVTRTTTPNVNNGSRLMIDQHRINAKPSILMTASGHINGSEIIHSWSQTSHYSIVDHDHGSTTSTALLVVIIFFGFALVGIFLLWRRHRYLQSHAICHYTTLNQELTLNSSDGPDSVDIQDFNLDVSGSSSSSDDEVYSSESDWNCYDEH